VELRTPTTDDTPLPFSLPAVVLRTGNFDGRGQPRFAD
jgi:hypothetical protein